MVWKCSAFLPEFRNWESAWALEALYVIAYEIRILAERVYLFISFGSKCFSWCFVLVISVFGVLINVGG